MVERAERRCPDALPGRDLRIAGAAEPDRARMPQVFAGRYLVNSGVSVDCDGYSRHWQTREMVICATHGVLLVPLCTAQHSTARNDLTARLTEILPKILAQDLHGLTAVTAVTAVTAGGWNSGWTGARIQLGFRAKAFMPRRPSVACPEASCFGSTAMTTLIRRPFGMPRWLQG